MKFYEKWNKLHLLDLSDLEYTEIMTDIEHLKCKYNYICDMRQTFANTRHDIGFYRIVELSKLTLKRGV